MKGQLDIGAGIRQCPSPASALLSLLLCKTFPPTLAPTAVDVLSMADREKNTNAEHVFCAKTEAGSKAKQGNQLWKTT